MISSYVQQKYCSRLLLTGTSPPLALGGQQKVSQHRPAVSLGSMTNACSRLTPESAQPLHRPLRTHVLRRSSLSFPIRSTRLYLFSQRPSRRLAYMTPSGTPYHLRHFVPFDEFPSLFGVSHLDVVRASTFVAQVLGKPQEAPKYTIPVIGGHSGATILPLLSQCEPKIVSDYSPHKCRRSLNIISRPISLMTRRRGMR